MKTDEPPAEEESRKSRQTRQTRKGSQTPILRLADAVLKLFYLKVHEDGCNLGMVTGKSGQTGDPVTRNSPVRSKNPSIRNVAMWAVKLDKTKVLALEKAMQDAIKGCGSKSIFSESFIMAVTDVDGDVDVDGDGDGDGDSEVLAKLVQTVDGILRQWQTEIAGVYRVQTVFVAKDVLDRCPDEVSNPDSVLDESFSEEDRERLQRQLVRMRDDENGRRRIGLLHKIQMATNTQGDKVLINRTQIRSIMQDRVADNVRGRMGKEVRPFQSRQCNKQTQLFSQQDRNTTPMR